MAAYHSIAVTLGQAGYLKELVSIVERMKQKPSRKIKNMRWKNWDPVRQPDVVVFNAVRSVLRVLIFKSDNIVENLMILGMAWTDT